MPEMIDNTSKYFDIYLELMNREPYKDYFERFFWGNAYEYLKLKRDF